MSEERQVDTSGFPMSDFNARDQQLVNDGEPHQLVLYDFRNAAVLGCVPSMHKIGDLLLMTENVHLAMAWLLEGAVRGHTGCNDSYLIDVCLKCSPEYTCVGSQLVEVAKFVG